MNRICCIFAGSPESGIPCLPPPEDAFLLCADSGLRHCEALGLQPDLVLGDFDSLGSIPDAFPHITAPVEKDDTDTMLAARYAISHGCSEVRIYGAFGGRFDHTFANLQTLRFLHENGVQGMLIGTNDIAALQGCGTVRYPKRKGFLFSVFAFTEECIGVTLCGTYYPLEDAVLTPAFPIGVSNRITDAFAEVTCKSGILLTVYSKEN